MGADRTNQRLLGTAPNGNPFFWNDRPPPVWAWATEDCSRLGRSRLVFRALPLRYSAD